MSIIDPKDDFFGRFFQRIDPQVAASFTAEQLAAIRRAFAPATHFVNIRRTLPFTRGRYYVVLLAGRERRAPARVEAELVRYPLWTRSNLLVFALFGVLTLLAVIGAAAVLFRGP